MANADDPNAGGAVITTEFVRHRNALLARGRLSELYLDYYLHLADCGLQVEPAHDQLFKQLLAAFLLHCASHPRREMVAWTANLQDPLLNLFATADNETFTVVGRVFTENVKTGEHNLLYVETARGNAPLRRSVISFDGSNLFDAAEAFYAQSEQRPGRYFDLGDENFAFLVSHPDCDATWFHQVSLDDIRDLGKRETLVPMESRRYQWRCGCTEQRIFEILAPSMREDPEDLFHGEDALITQCPRCGALYRIGREALEAYVAQHPAG